MLRLASGPSVLALHMLVLALPALAQNGQPGSSPGNPFIETSAGRAWQRIAFAAIDCISNPDTTPGVQRIVCPNDAFTTSGVFINGTYRDIRFNFAGALPGTPSASDFLANRVITQSQTFPQASSASGFTFTWNGPTKVRDSQMFGPLFGDRGRTNGRKQLSVTLTLQNLKWEKLDSAQIRNDQAGLLWGDNAYADFGNGPAGYVGRCRMNINSLITSLAVNYGVADRVDLTVSVPIVHTTVEGSNQFVDYVIQADGTPTANPDITFFTPQPRYYVKGSSTGIGDMTAGVTVAVVRNETTALALTGRVNIGTGSYDKMTGTGQTQVSGGLVGSYQKGRVAPHFTAAYLGSNDTLFNEARGVFGLDLEAVPQRLTVSAEILGRRLFNVQGFEATHTFGTVSAFGDTFQVRDFRAVRNDYNLYFVNIGGKARLAGQFLGTAYLLIPWGNQGLIAQKPSWNFGLNYAF